MTFKTFFFCFDIFKQNSKVHDFQKCQKKTFYMTSSPKYLIQNTSYVYKIIFIKTICYI